MICNEMITLKHIYVPPLLLVFISSVNAFIKCGQWECFGTGAYCCDGEPTSCCYYAWSFWWFWMFWIFVFVLLISCVFWCRRRFSQRDSSSYYLVRNTGTTGIMHNPPAYGTMSFNSAYADGPATEPRKPPEYTNEKPPDYFATMGASSANSTSVSDTQRLLEASTRSEPPAYAEEDNHSAANNIAAQDPSAPPYTSTPTTNSN